MINLDLVASTLVLDPLHGVAVALEAQGAFGQYAASSARHRVQVDHVPPEHVVALIAAVAIHVCPFLPELVAVIAGEFGAGVLKLIVQCLQD